MQGHSVTATG